MVAREPQVLALQTCFEGGGTEGLGAEHGVGASPVGSSDSWVTKQPSGQAGKKRVRNGKHGPALCLNLVSRRAT